MVISAVKSLDFELEYPYDDGAVILLLLNARANCLVSVSQRHGFDD